MWLFTYGIFYLWKKLCIVIQFATKRGRGKKSSLPTIIWWLYYFFVFRNFGIGVGRNWLYMTFQEWQTMYPLLRIQQYLLLGIHRSPAPPKFDSSIVSFHNLWGIFFKVFATFCSFFFLFFFVGNNNIFCCFYRARYCIGCWSCCTSFPHNIFGSHLF